MEDGLAGMGNLLHTKPKIGPPHNPTGAAETLDIGSLALKMPHLTSFASEDAFEDGTRRSPGES